MAGQAGCGRAHSRCQQARKVSFQMHGPVPAGHQAAFPAVLVRPEVVRVFRADGQVRLSFSDTISN
jgi:hypothetical protein